MVLELFGILRVSGVLLTRANVFTSAAFGAVCVLVAGKFSELPWYWKSKRTRQLLTLLHSFPLSPCPDI